MKFLSKVSPEFELESDEDLLEYMSWKDDTDTATAAWRVFFERHCDYLYGVCYRAHAQQLGGRDAVLDLAHDVFARAFERAETYRPCGSSDTEDMRKNVRAWLGTIARNLVCDRFRKSRTALGSLFVQNDYPQELSAETRVAESLSDDERICRRALSTLSWKEQLVLRITMYYDNEPGSRRLPSGVAMDLAEQIGTQPETIRQIRRRAFAKLEKALTDAGVGTTVRSA